MGGFCEKTEHKVINWSNTSHMHSNSVWGALLLGFLKEEITMLITAVNTIASRRLIILRQIQNPLNGIRFLVPLAGSDKARFTFNYTNCVYTAICFISLYHQF